VGRAAREGRLDELLEQDLIEAGPTLRGANDQTDLLALKSRPLTTTTDSTATVQIDPAVKASEDDARLRSHLRSNHAVQGRMLLRRFSIPDLIRVHRLAHASGAGASQEHIRTGLPTAGKSEAEVRALVDQLYDQNVLPGQLEQLEADEEIFGARIRKREREERRRAIKRTQVRR
jgi:hypothetical protein